jgi:flavin-dependent dehydrogenase
MYDAIVVGARCAGSPTAMLLARKGYRVLLVDRITFPSDTFRNHALLQPALLKLKRWGLLDEVIATNCPPIREIKAQMGPFELVAQLTPTDGLAGLYAPRRKYLDHILARAAVAAGAELREGFTVEELLWDDDKVVGIRGRGQGGASVTEHAPIVIGADGLHSVVARGVNAPTYQDVPTLTWIYYSYWSDVALGRFEMHRADDVAMLGFPTNDGLTCVAAFGPAEGFEMFREDIEGNFERTLDRFPAFADQVRAGSRAERWIGTADLPNFFRTPYGPGWALVGDAGYHKDPVTANGITDAFRDAEALAEAIDAGFSGRQPLQEALAAYQQQRDEVALPHFQVACQNATFGPLPPEMQGLFAALVGNLEDTAHFFETTFQIRPAAEFFAPENIGRIMSAYQPNAA